MDDLPKATPVSEKKTPSTPEEKQLEKWKKAARNMSSYNPTVSFNLNEPLLESVREKMESRGFQVSYNLYYSSTSPENQKYNCVVYLTNPGLLQEAKESASNFADQVNVSELLRIFLPRA